MTSLTIVIYGVTFILIGVYAVITEGIIPEIKRKINYFYKEIKCEDFILNVRSDRLEKETEIKINEIIINTKNSYFGDYEIKIIGKSIKEEYDSTLGTTFWQFDLYGINFFWSSDNQLYRARVGKKQLKNFLKQLKSRN